jgi:glycosyltransferase involved in cell wall biosynthesis
MILTRVRNAAKRILERSKRRTAHDRLVIAANMGVCDEVELIGPSIRHLRAIGVDLIVITDVGSADGTTDILREFARDPDIHLIELSRDADPWGFPERMYQHTMANHEVDRVLFLDPDEFWLPSTGRLKDLPWLLDTDVARVSNFNVPMVEQRPSSPADLRPENYRNIYFVTDPVRDGRSKVDNDPRATISMIGVPPKVMINPDRVVGASMGCHDAVKKPGIEPRSLAPTEVVIAHYQFTTLARFERKVANIRRSFEHFGHRLDRNQAWHWRRWLEMADEGRIEEEFHRQAITQREFDALRSSGVIQSAQQWLDGKGVAG